jgi:hypothetical protein
MIRYHLPTVEDLLRLGEPQSNAVTVYLPTSPTPEGRAKAVTAGKSAIDESLRKLKASGASPADLEAIREQWDLIAEDPALWGRLSNSLAIFISTETSEEYVLPNSLERQSQAGEYFDIGQLVRAVSTPQDAFALTLSSNGWNLWRASADARAEELELSDEYPLDVADATHRMTARGRQHLRRLVGSEGKKLLLERYARTVADAMKSELGRIDPHANKPVFVFAAEPLLSLIQGESLPWKLVPVHGSPDNLRPHQIDEAVRERIGAVAAEQVSARAEAIGDGLTAGLAITDLAQIARAASRGAISTLIYDFTVDIMGTIDDATGQLVYDDDGYDLLSRIAVLVLQKGGEAIAVRPEEVTASVWNGQVLAQLRHTLT